MVPNIDLDYVLLWGYSILYKEYYLTGLNHQKTLLKWKLPPLWKKKLQTPEPGNHKTVLTV